MCSRIHCPREELEMDKKGKTIESSQKEDIKWTDEIDNVFIDTMLEQQARGFMVDGTFTSAAYKNLLETIERVLGIILTKDNLKNRIKTLKNNFSTCYELFKNKSGINWSHETKMFQAEDQVCDELIEANPNMKRWRITLVNNFDKLEDFFSKDRDTGSLSSTCYDFMQMWTKESEDPNENLFSISYSNLFENIDESSPHATATPPTNKTNDDSTPSKSSKRKRNSFGDTHDAHMENTNQHLGEIVKCMKLMV